MDKRKQFVAADHAGISGRKMECLFGQDRVIRKNGVFGTLLRVAVTLAIAMLLGCGSSDTSSDTPPMLGAPPSDWMKAISDQTPISRLSIPGTHDSGTYTQDQTSGGGYVKTQMWSFYDQLSVLGIRFLDIRCRLIGDGFAIHHERVFLGLSFQDVIDQCRSFLLTHPNETILMDVGHEWQDEEGSSLSFHQVFLNYYNANKYLDEAHTRELWYLGTTIPTLGQVRGKIVLMRNFDLDPGAAAIGIAMPPGQNTAFYSYQFSTNPDETVYVENLWTPDAPIFTDAFDIKWRAIQDNIGLAQKDSSPNHLYMTFTSATMFPWHTPLEFAQHINWQLKVFPAGSGPMGIVVMDYPGDEAYSIINTNAGD